MRPRYLLVKGMAGLGNRLFTLSVGMRYALATERKLWVDWSDGQFSKKGINPFHSYFSIQGLPHIKDLNEIDSEALSSVYPRAFKNNLGAAMYDLYTIETRYSGLARFRLHHLPFAAFKKIWGYWELKELASKGAWRHFLNPECPPLLAHYPRGLQASVVVGSDFCLKHDPALLKKHLAWNSEFKQRAQTVMRNLGLGPDKNIIAVHIRHTDSKPLVPLSQVFEALRVHRVRGEALFLSTDSREVLALMRAHYPNLITFDKNLPDTSGKGLHQVFLDDKDEAIRIQAFEASLIEFFILSQADVFLFQGNSTFSKAAAIMAKEGQRALDWTLGPVSCQGT